MYTIGEYNSLEIISIDSDSHAHQMTLFPQCFPQMFSVIEVITRYKIDTRTPSNAKKELTNSIIVFYKFKRIRNNDYEFIIERQFNLLQ